MASECHPCSWSDRGWGWQAVSGGALIALSVPVLVFIALRPYFVRGLIVGAVDGRRW